MPALRVTGDDAILSIVIGEEIEAPCPDAGDRTAIGFPCPEYRDTVDACLLLPGELMIARRVIVEGVVQGVGFRWATRDEAARLGVSGWVRNREDGSVEAHVEGSDPAVEELLDWLSRGPLGSVVAQVSVEPASPVGLGGFEVRP